MQNHMKFNRVEVKYCHLPQDHILNLNVKRHLSEKRKKKMHLCWSRHLENSKSKDTQNNNQIQVRNSFPWTSLTINLTLTIDTQQ